MNLAQVFQSPEHQSFHLEGGQPAALLLHGFPGTPAETRPLAEALHRAGWTVHGLLLPGFGPELETLGQRRHDDWVAATVQATGALQQRHHRPILLAGFSMGAAVAMLAAAYRRPQGLALLAPFAGQMGGIATALPVMRRLMPTIRPFRLFRPDFENPGVRSGMANFLPGLDLDDPRVQQDIHNLAIPTSILDEVRLVGQAAWRAAPAVTTPTLLVQGANDMVVRPSSTLKLAARLAGPVQYLEAPAAHDLLDGDKPAWPAIEAAVLAFARELECEK